MLLQPNKIRFWNHIMDIAQIFVLKEHIPIISLILANYALVIMMVENIGIEQMKIV